MFFLTSKDSGDTGTFAGESGLSCAFSGDLFESCFDIAGLYGETGADFMTSTFRKQMQFETRRRNLDLPFTFLAFLIDVLVSEGGFFG